MRIGNKTRKINFRLTESENTIIKRFMREKRLNVSEVVRLAIRQLGEIQ